MDDDMKLPAGKTCEDCRWYSRCEWLISCEPSNTTCDWAPSRFVEKAREEAMQDELGTFPKQHNQNNHQ